MPTNLKLADGAAAIGAFLLLLASFLDQSLGRIAWSSSFFNELIGVDLLGILVAVVVLASSLGRVPPRLAPYVAWSAPLSLAVAVFALFTAISWSNLSGAGAGLVLAVFGAAFVAAGAAARSIPLLARPLTLPTTGPSGGGTPNPAPDPAAVQRGYQGPPAAGGPAPPAPSPSSWDSPATSVPPGRDGEPLVPSFMVPPNLAVPGPSTAPADPDGSTGTGSPGSGPAIPEPVAGGPGPAAGTVPGEPTSAQATSEGPTTSDIATTDPADGAAGAPPTADRPTAPPDQPFAPFWAAVPQVRAVYRTDNTSVRSGEVLPGTWYAIVAVHDSGGLVVALPAGDHAVLTDTSGLIRG